MTRRDAGLRYVAALVALLGVLSYGPVRGLAQDEGTFEADVYDGYVSVWCGDNSDGSTTCTFAGALESGEPIDYIYVRLDQLCGAEVLSPGPEALIVDSYQFAGNVATVVLSGSFTVSDTVIGEYTVDSGLDALLLSGPAIACTPPSEEPPAEETPVDGGGDPPVDVTPVDETPVDETPTEETPVDKTPVDETPVDETPIVEEPGEATPATEPPGQEPAPGSDISDEEVEGLIQLVKGQCPTAGEARTEITVIGPNTLMAQAEAVSGCGAQEGAAFLVTGGSLPEEGESYTTGPDGAYRGSLPPGTYTVTEVASGESVEIEVVADGIVVVVAVEYIPAVTGTLAVRRYVCIEGDTEVLHIDAYNQSEEPDPGANCAPEEGQFELAGGEPFNGGGDGAITFEVPIGTYTFNEISLGLTTDIGIAEGATTFVVVRRVLPFGELSVLYTFCADEDAHSGDPGDPDFWADECDDVVAGVGLDLLDASGQLVATATTDEWGFARWSNLLPGTYRIKVSGSAGTCAVFIGSTAGLSGFTVSANTIYQGTVYGCTIPDDGTGPGNNTGGNNTPGNNTGGNNTPGNNTGGNNGGNNGGNDGDGTGGVGDGAAGNYDTGGPSGGIYVTTLPQTGTSRPEHSLPLSLALAIGLAALSAGCLAARWRRLT